MFFFWRSQLRSSKKNLLFFLWPRLKEKILLFFLHSCYDTRIVFEKKVPLPQGVNNFWAACTGQICRRDLGKQVSTWFGWARDMHSGSFRTLYQTKTWKVQCEQNTPSSMRCIKRRRCTRYSTSKLLLRQCDSLWFQSNSPYCRANYNCNERSRSRVAT